MIVHPGQPLRVMESVTVKGERLDGGGIAEHDVSGWVMMPPDHWDLISAEFKRLSAPKTAPVAPAQPTQPPAR